MLLVLSYLQQCDPPVIPYLQERAAEQPVYIYEGGRQHNTYFDTVDNITFEKKNTQTVAELLVGFFEFYGLHFEWATDVVTTRRPRDKKLPLDGENWVIEDPFETWRNMAASTTYLGRCMILTALRHGVAMARSQLHSLWDLCMPRDNMERYFLRIPAHRLPMEADLGAQLLTLLQRIGPNRPTKYVVVERDGPPFKREIFIEFEDKQLRYEGMSLAQQQSKGQHSFFLVGGDCFTHALGEATTITTRTA